MATKSSFFAFFPHILHFMIQDHQLLSQLHPFCTIFTQHLFDRVDTLSIDTNFAQILSYLVVL